MERQLEGLWDPKDGAYGLAVMTVRLMHRVKGHVTTRDEVLAMQERAGRAWTEEEIAGILAANGTTEGEDHDQAAQGTVRPEDR